MSIPKAVSTATTTNTTNTTGASARTSGAISACTSLPSPPPPATGATGEDVEAPTKARSGGRRATPPPQGKAADGGASKDTSRKASTCAEAAGKGRGRSKTLSALDIVVLYSLNGSTLGMMNMYMNVDYYRQQMHYYAHTYLPHSVISPVCC